MLDPVCQRFVPAQLPVEVFGGRGQPEHVRLALGHGRSHIQPLRAGCKETGLTRLERLRQGASSCHREAIGETQPAK